LKLDEGLEISVDRLGSRSCPVAISLLNLQGLLAKNFAIFTKIVLPNVVFTNFVIIKFLDGIFLEVHKQIMNNLSWNSS
jgi:hypothetical protein